MSDFAAWLHDREIFDDPMGAFLTDYCTSVCCPESGTVEEVLSHLYRVHSTFPTPTPAKRGYVLTLAIRCFKEKTRGYIRLPDGRWIVDAQELSQMDLPCRRCGAGEGQPCGGRMWAGVFHAPRTDQLLRLQRDARNTLWRISDDAREYLKKTGAMA